MRLRTSGGRVRKDGTSVGSLDVTEEERSRGGDEGDS
jgi:hypothetical protein